ncbi:putative zinc protease y4wA [Halomicronema hongdechloris C2206]|uniref:Zinc protease y4wA n=1 Tax=Halomicronema hongdechloris C2206 TaxID=1641165 RepID=A0A1Z3HUG5_9CYAN|nr:pitrilysin family protein [Halomicronema hongdechloris]ASC73939.1 putative zinc protease y4wA [Halomicronema hongdechloris C2206]
MLGWQGATIGLRRRIEAMGPGGRIRWRPLLGLVVVLVWLGLPTTAVARESTDSTSTVQPYLQRVAEEISEFTLDNGMKVIVLERHQAPVVSFMLYANVGAANEAAGKTGLAHYLEHLAFKGTTQIGTRNYRAEKRVLEDMDQVFAQLLAAEDRGDDATAKQRRQQLETLKAKAAEYVEQNQYGQIVEQAGGVGLNATTGADATRYFYSLPSNKLELWMSLESERFLEPVFREFYQEKEVILEERRTRVDNSPIGKMVEEFLEASFVENPYRRPIIGYAEDLYRMTREDVQQFFKTYYGPRNLIATVVGDVDPARVQELAAVYFGRYRSRATPPPVVFDEPAQTQPRDFTLELPSEPWYLEGYHRPAITHPDHVIYGMIDSLLVDGRTSRLYKTLVEETQVALDTSSLNGFPGDKYANIFLLYALTAPGHTLDEVAEQLRRELQRLQQEPVADADLDRVKTQARARLLRRLDSNAGMAALLAEYEAKTGSWRNVFKELAAIEAVTAADVQRVARATFRPDNRTVGRLITSRDES